MQGGRSYLIASCSHPRICPGASLAAVRNAGRVRISHELNNNWAQVKGKPAGRVLVGGWEGMGTGDGQGLGRLSDLGLGFLQSGAGFVWPLSQPPYHSPSPLAVMALPGWEPWGAGAGHRGALDLRVKGAC